MAKLIPVEPASWDSPGYRAAIAAAASIIRRGGLVGFPTETVYGLAADALDPAAVARVFAVKRRPPDSPLLLCLAESSEAKLYAAELPAVASALMERFWPGPLTLVCRKAAIVPAITAGGGDAIGMRVPGHKVARDLAAAAGRPIVAPSANMTGRPSPLLASDVLAELGTAIDAVLDAGPSPLGIESTVIDLTVHPPRIIRPGSITLEQLREVLGDVEAGQAAATAPAAARAVATITQAATLDSAERKANRLGARLVLLAVSPGPAAVAKAIDLALAYQAEGQRPAILAMAVADAIPAGILHQLLGPDLETAAATYYGALRSLEAAGAAVIIACPVPRQGLGLAIMSRLEKAADEVIS